MATKLAKGTYPESASAEDFQCFGPAATEDGQFDSARICDMGCFTQDDKDTNKYYHGAVVQHKTSKNWYAYFEWGRTGAAKPSFQFVECASEDEAVVEFAKQLHSKNDKRGEWVDLAGLRTLRAKKGKDCYLVRPQATRSTGLPDARSIKSNEAGGGDGKAKATDKTAAKKKPRKKRTSTKYDDTTMSLLCDLSASTIAYTRGAMADSSLPTQKALDEARTLLTEAQKRLLKVGDDENKQVKDKDLNEITKQLYGRIPKKKPVGAAKESWVLSKKNILAWQSDLDAFEAALYSQDVEGDEPDFDPFEGRKITMEWIPKDSKVGKMVYKWWPTATNNRHHWVRSMTIKNLWEIEREEDKKPFPAAQKKVIDDNIDIAERPLFQPKRDDVTAATRKKYDASGTALLFHGTRSVNVMGLLREALRLPKQLVGVVITGAMFGPGLYFADDWKKSAGYTSLPNSYWAQGGGAVSGRSAFMFAADVVLGNPYDAPGAHGYVEPPKGHHSVFGKGGGQTGLQNNEFVVYDAAQCRLRYLIEFTAK